MYVSATLSTRNVFILSIMVSISYGPGAKGTLLPPHQDQRLHILGQSILGWRSQTWILGLSSLWLFRICELQKG